MSAPNILGRYKIEAHLGTGAFADVYKATDQTLDRTVALKVLKPTLIADGEAFSRFVREAKITANLFNPHTATVLDLGEADGHYFLAMRYVDGRSLEKILAAGRGLSWDEALKITEQIGGALDFAHKKGLVHRDVKPQNILISNDEEGAVLTDFGLVRAMATSGMTTTGSFLGTPAYMAPEIWEGKDATAATDQYALACVLVEMLTGKVLFDGKTPPAVMAKHFQTPSLPPDLPEHVVIALQRALARSSAERHESIHAFIDSLDDLPQKPRLEPRPVPKRPARKVDGAQPQKQKVKRDLVSGSHLQIRGNRLTVTLATGIDLAFVRIPAGEFLMGTGAFGGFFIDNGPQHKVDLPQYWIGKAPVTNIQYRTFVKATGYLAPDYWGHGKIPKGMEEHPVTEVAWDDARAFCQWASKLIGASILLETIHLPSEAEWEKAARGTDGREYPWGNQEPDKFLCNYDNNVGDTSAVGSYSPAGDSPYGCVDMAGNVWEWTSSSYEKYPFLGKDGRQDETLRKPHAVRGGSWDKDENFMPCSSRFKFDVSDTDFDLGFRCCCNSLRK